MKEADGMDMVYTVETNGKKDTIRLFLPISVKKVAVPKPTPPVKEYIRNQGRYSHLLNNDTDLKIFQNMADDNIKKYNL